MTDEFFYQINIWGLEIKGEDFIINRKTCYYLQEIKINVKQLHQFYLKREMKAENKLNEEEKWKPFHEAKK